MRILVTGASGFLGHHLVAQATQKGHEVVALSRTAVQRQVDGDGVSWISADFREVTMERLRGLNLDACIHAAWSRSSGAVLDSRSHHDMMVASVEFGRCLLAAGVENLVCTGSCAEYGWQSASGKCVEYSTPINPATVYGQAKAELHRNLGKFWPKDALLWPRIFYAFGPGESAGKLCSYTIDQLSRGLAVTVQGGSDPKDFIYVTDVCSAIIVLLEAEASGAVNIGYGSGQSPIELVTEIAKFYGSPKVQIEPSSAQDELGARVADNSLLLSHGWRPQFSVRSGIRNLMEKQGHLRDATNHNL